MTQPTLSPLVGMSLQEADVANQMRPTVLGLDIGIPGKGAVRRKVVKMNVTVVVADDPFFQYLSATTGSDRIQGKQRCGDAPDPVFLAVVLQARFVTTEHTLCWG